MNIIKTQTTSHATCFKIKLKNNVLMCFTDLDQDIIIDGISYSAKSGLNTSNIENNLDLSLDNLSIMGIVDSPLINEQDLISGLYNNAEIEIFAIDYNSPLKTKKLLKTGFIHEIKVINNKFYAQIYGLSIKLESEVGQIYSPTCRAKFGDQRCSIKHEQYTKISQISNIESEVSFIDNNLKEPNNYYNNGELSFITGKNAQISCAIKTYHSNKITLYNKMPYQMHPGDQYKIIAGCDKTFTTCKLKFKNALNFRGEPHVPING